MNIVEKIKRRDFRICLVGLGYVGLPLLIQFARADFPIIGMDLSKEKINMLREGHSYISDVEDTTLRELNNKRVSYTTQYELCRQAEAVIICVPTPLDEGQNPDLSYLCQSVEGIAPHLKEKAVLVVESTSYPGTVEEIVLPILRRAGRTPGTDFYLAYSPERIDPGNRIFSLVNTPKLIGGTDTESTELARVLYEQIIEQVIPVSSIKVAEMAKITENAFRAVNIAFVNELAMICHRLSIDVWEVLEAASTKPFGFVPFFPGPGIGGHCIPIDPEYLIWKLKEINVPFQMIETASRINRQMPDYIVERVIHELQQRQREIAGARVLILGAAYKRDVNDVRESPALRIMDELEKRKADVRYHDPLIPVIQGEAAVRSSVPLTSQMIREQDVVILVTDHSAFDYAKIAGEATLIIDTRNAFAAYPSEHIIPL